MRLNECDRVGDSMTERYSHLEPTETSKKARDILNKLNQTPEPDLKVVG